MYCQSFLRHDNDVEKAEHGIIFIDEIDQKKETPTVVMSVESLIQGMLKLLEGSRSTGRCDEQKCNGSDDNINTRNILFICGGAFPELDRIKNRLTKQSLIGFNAQLSDEFDKDENILQTGNSLREFGMIPEFLGRLPVVFTGNDRGDVKESSDTA